MRALLLLLLLAVAFAGAALWQDRQLGQLRADREALAQVAEGRLGETDSGFVPEGWAVVTVGRPSGAGKIVIEPAPASIGEAAPPPNEAGGPPADWRALGDFELVVQTGQTLSGIAKTHYGTAGGDLVRALAEYNGMDDPDRLRLGQDLSLPPIERLR